LKEKLEAVRALGVTDGVCENLGAVSLARNANFRLHGGHGLNILNSIALEEYRQFVLASATLSLECACKEIRAMGGELSRGVLVYGYLPLMRMRACPAKTLHGCGSCTGNNRLIDRKGISFPLVCSERQFTTLYNSLPLFVCDKLPKTVDFYTYYFTQETPEEAAQILCLGKSGTAPEFPRTNGLYFRELR